MFNNITMLQIYWKIGQQNFFLENPLEINKVTAMSLVSPYLEHP